MRAGARLNLLFLLILIVVIVALVQAAGRRRWPTKTALVLDLHGAIAEQKAGNLRPTALDAGRAARRRRRRCSCATCSRVLEAAAKADPKIRAPCWCSTSSRPRAWRRCTRSPRRSTASRRAARRSSPGARATTSASTTSPRTPTRSTCTRSARSTRRLRRLSQLLQGRARQARRHRATCCASAPTRARPSRTSPTSRRRRRARPTRALYGALWTTYTDASRRRASSPRRQHRARHRRAAGSASPRPAATRAKLALAEKLVDGLKTRDELRALLIARGAKDDERKTFRQISFDEYLGRCKPQADRRRGRRRRRRRRDRRRHRAGRHVGGLSTAGADPQGARRRAHQGDRAARQFARRQRVRLRAGAARARARARGRQAGRRLDGRPRRVGRLLDLDRVRRGDRRRRPPSPARSACSRLLPTADKALDKLGVHADGVTTTWLGGAATRAGRSTRASAEVVQASIDHTYAEFTAQGRAGAQDDAGEDRRGRAGPGLDRRAGARARPRRPARQLRRCARFGRGARQARRRATASSTSSASRAGSRSCVEHVRRRRWRASSARGSTRSSPASACRRGGARGVARDLGWLADVDRAKRPFAAVVALPLRSALSERRRPPPRRRLEHRPDGGGAPPRRPVPRAGRRRLGQDARDHAQDRAPAAGRLRAGADRRDHVHQQGRAGDARAREGAGRPARREGPGDQHLPFARRAHPAQRWRARSA